jgi:hypothetical protein
MQNIARLSACQDKWHARIYWCMPKYSRLSLTLLLVGDNFAPKGVRGTSHCIIAGNSNATIQSLGTDNVIVNTGSAP